MGREVRRVAADWKHPVGQDGKYKPLCGGRMPGWKPGVATHYQMYETTSAGTPVSPVMDSAEGLARWLVEHGASACGEQTAGYEAWLHVCRGHPAMTFAVEDGRIFNGVAYASLAHKSACCSSQPAGTQDDKTNGERL